MREQPRSPVQPTKQQSLPQSVHGRAPLHCPPHQAVSTNLHREELVMKPTIQQTCLATLLAAVATLSHAQTSTTADGRSTTRGSTTSPSAPYDSECVPDVSSGGQPGTGQKAGKHKDKAEKGSSGSMHSGSQACRPGTTRVPCGSQGGVSPGASSPDAGAGSMGSGTRSTPSPTPDSSSKDSSRSNSGSGSGAGAPGTKSAPSR